MCIRDRYTAVHKACAALPKEIREVECLKVLYPTLFRKITNQDLIAGRTDFLPIGFGCVTSLGGVGHYCVFKKLRAFQLQLDETERKRVDALYDYWLDHDLKTQFNKEVLTEDTLGMFIDLSLIHIEMCIRDRCTDCGTCADACPTEAIHPAE